MNIVEWRKLGEALEWWDKAQQDGSPNSEKWTVVLAAARLTYDRYQECDNPECDEGRIWEYQDNSTADQWYDCPSCGGSGLQPNQARIMEWCKKHDYPRLGTQTGSCEFGAGLDEPCDLFIVEVRAFDKEAE